MMNGGFGHGFGGLGMILFWGVTIALVVLFARDLMQRPGEGSDRKNDRKSAREILDERYARGEIDVTEYEEKKRALTPK